ncbi:MAG: hypothetical protein N2Z58_09065 [Fervidobacterium sp.]|nr:hypothetical protein [Fervidobacterium sp.]
MRNELKRQLIGTTSWLVPGTYYENARLVAQFVDFVELLVYTWDDETKDLISSEVEKLFSLTQSYGLSYTVHLPVDNFGNVLRAIYFFENIRDKLNIINYILHPFEVDDFELLLTRFTNISVENLKEKVYYSDRMVFDIGHHLLGNRVDFSKIKDIKEIHLMGIKNGKDHLTTNEETFNLIYQLLSQKLFDIELICFEVFSLKDFIDSLISWTRWKNSV